MIIQPSNEGCGLGATGSLNNDFAGAAQNRYTILSVYERISACCLLENHLTKILHFTFSPAVLGRVA